MSEISEAAKSAASDVCADGLNLEQQRAVQRRIQYAIDTEKTALEQTNAQLRQQLEESVKYHSAEFQDRIGLQDEAKILRRLGGEAQQRIDWLSGQREIEVQQKEAALNEAGEWLKNNEFLRKENRILASQRERMKVERDEAQQQRDAAVADLDWIEESLRKGTDVFYGPNTKCFYVDSSSPRSPNGETLRAAIAAARTQTKEGK